MLQLSEQEQYLLLKVARDAVKAQLINTSPLKSEIPYGPLTEQHSAFVSIHNGPRLRGCVGTIRPILPLYRTIEQCAVSAAGDDPRFHPLTMDELPKVAFEISVLSEMEPVKRLEEIVIGQHGLHISNGTAAGLLLPQVASSQRWSRERFLAETCRKAGLEPSTDLNIHRFTALVFGEHQFQPASVS
jgi:AmmeMemoRadiSam system protein A